MNFKLIVDEGGYIQGSEVKMSVIETMNFKVALGELYSNPKVPDTDKVIIAKMLDESDFMNAHPCTYCSNNPKNGGSGICHCTLGGPDVIY